jgi:hypothetical protein
MAIRAANLSWLSICDQPSFSIGDVSKHDFRKPHHKLSKPGVFLEQRDDVVVGEFVKGIIVTPK